MKSILIHGGRVITETGLIPGGYVLIEGDKIISVGAEDEKPERADSVIDAGGKYISPGFIDMHTHGIHDVDFMESDEETMERGLRAYARFGVTRLLATTLSNPLDSIIAQIKRISRVKTESGLGGMLAGVHIEGPWLAERCRGGHAAEYLRVPEEKEIRLLFGEIGDVVKTVTYAPELPNTSMLTEELTRRGIVPVFGHTEAGYDDAERCIQKGARHVTHMYDTTLGYGENPNEALVMMPGMETSVMMNDDVSIELIGCPVHVPPPFFKLVNKVKPRNKRVVVTDSLVGAGLENGTEFAYKDGRRIYVKDGVLRMIDEDPKVNGNLTGSAVTMNTAISRVARFAGLPVEEAVRWGSINPALTIGIEHETGSLKPGKTADITVFDDGFNVELTLVRGRIVYDGVTNRKTADKPGS
jgi:N-acetylglucosamine-6-phosphate deacetylase